MALAPTCNRETLQTAEPFNFGKENSVKEAHGGCVQSPAAAEALPKAKFAPVKSDRLLPVAFCCNSATR